MIDITQFKIDKEIPIPDKDKKGMRLLESKMNIGDSILFFDSRLAKGLRNRISEAGFKATTRKISKNKWRVWKVSKENES